MNLGMAFRYHREKLGMTQEDMANKLGIMRQTYCHYENGARQPSVYRAAEMAKIYKITLDELVQTAKKFD